MVASPRLQARIHGTGFARARFFISSCFVLHLHLTDLRQNTEIDTQNDSVIHWECYKNAAVQCSVERIVVRICLPTVISCDLKYSMPRFHQISFPLDIRPRGHLPFSDILPRITEINETTSVWEIKETISQLAYLTHGYFRYYGKFPSTLAGQLMEQYPVGPGEGVLDNYCGSGTTLVEASRRRIHATGIDLSPLAVLAGKVKTAIFETSSLRSDLDKLLKALDVGSPRLDEEDFVDGAKWAHKWFTREVAVDLFRLKKVIMELPSKDSEEFFSIAFLAIVRRVSLAFDGEVRPHINKAKKQRGVKSAFLKKCEDMISRQDLFNELHPDRIPSQTILSDSSADYSKELQKVSYRLVISHPPYLNCFDYLQVYSLELRWSEDMPAVWKGLSRHDFSETLRPSEVKTTVRSTVDVDAYYRKLKDAYTQTYLLQPKGGICAVVVGDCKIKDHIEAVHLKLIPIMEEIGYKFIKLNYRETHYATGKYSYDFRADYHGEAAEKKDAIVVFQK